ncbi:hypothetical protein BDW62DRAFT_7234 [Aspergillus aurantiobrunneus]
MNGDPILLIPRTSGTFLYIERPEVTYIRKDTPSSAELFPSLSSHSLHGLNRGTRRYLNQLGEPTGHFPMNQGTDSFFCSENLSLLGSNLFAGSIICRHSTRASIYREVSCIQPLSGLYTRSSPINEKRNEEQPKVAQASSPPTPRPFDRPKLERIVPLLLLQVPL